MKNNIKKYREWFGYTQEELAYICSVNRRTIIRVESGKNVPNTLLLARLEYVLCCTGSRLYFLDPFELAECDRRREIVLRHNPNILEPLDLFETVFPEEI